MDVPSMDVHEKEVLQPFLHGDHSGGESYRDASLELTELTHRATDTDRQHAAGDSPDDGNDDGGEALGEKPPVPGKRPATYAIVFMLGAQVFSASMNVSIRLLENASTHLHPLQILFARMSVTTLGITLWLWRQNKPNNILGKSENRILLLVRAFGGFLGVFGLYYSLQYLNLSEATVITFMMPLVASFAGYLLLRSPLSWVEILLSVLSLLGVLLVASPDAALFSSLSSSSSSPDGAAVDPTAVATARIWALGVGLLGVCGSAAAFLCMSAVGKAEDPLTVVNYFAAMCTAISGAALVVVPGLGFRAPGGAGEWSLLVASGVSGFLMQFLITLSLQAEKSLVAVNMVYTQIVFALVLDALVFRAVPHAVSLGGCALICGSAVFLAWHKTRARRRKTGGGAEEGGRD